MKPLLRRKMVRRISVPLASGLLMVMAWALSPAGADEQQETAPRAGQPKKATEEKTERPALPGPPNLPTIDKPTGKLLQTAWYLMTYEADKIGYINRALYRVDGPGSAAYRVEVRRFLRPSLDADNVGVFEDSTMLVDKDFAAVSFRTSRRGLDVEEMTIEGTVAEGELKVSATSGSARRSWTNKLQGRPTFAGALLFWLGRQRIAEEARFARTVINERSGTFQGQQPVALRVVQKAQMMLDNKRQDAWLVSERNGLFSTVHFLRADGRLYRSQGQNHNLTYNETPGTDAARLDLSGEVKWKNNVMLKVGNGVSSEAFGYKLAVPPYPYMPVVVGYGRYLAVTNFLGGDQLFVFVTYLRAGDPDARERLYKSWTRNLPQNGEPVKLETVVDKVPAVVYRIKTRMGGRETAGRLSVVVRHELGYLIGQMAPWPSRAAESDVFDTLLGSVSWSTAYGREKGMWDGAEYVSYSHDYRVRLLGPGWQLPERRSGVPTNIEVVSKDRSAMISLKIEPARQGIDIKAPAANYRRMIETKMPGVANLSEKQTTLDGRPAIELAYEAKAIENEPTRTRHVLAVKGTYLYILTFVGKTATLGATEGRFAEVIESFKFGKDNENTTPDN
ncbi:MAG: hypothetical protein GWP05_02715 [Anaerolineaceae bacterium]|nr:hypothetical protein [Anaerolineaceae bacterium]